MGSIVVADEIFEKYPSFRRGIVIARNMENKTDDSELNEMLKMTLADRFDNPVDLENDSRITDWKEAHRSFGSNPNKFPPAHIALIKRIQKQKTEIPFINSVVAVMNIVSVSNILPVGGDDIIAPGSTFRLGISSGSESFIPLGMPDKEENPVSGEVIYFIEESGDVMCRRWNWRNGDKTKINEKTQNIIMNIDAIGADSEERALKARNMVAELLEKYCQAETEKTLLFPDQRSYRF